MKPLQKYISQWICFEPLDWFQLLLKIWIIEWIIIRMNKNHHTNKKTWNRESEEQREKMRLLKKKRQRERKRQWDRRVKARKDGEERRRYSWGWEEKDKKKEVCRDRDFLFEDQWFMYTSIKRLSSKWIKYMFYLYIIYLHRSQNYMSKCPNILLYNSIFFTSAKTGFQKKKNNNKELFLLCYNSIYVHELISWAEWYYWTIKCKG